MDWTKNLILYCDTKKPGKCPKCKSESIEVTEHKSKIRTSWTFVCKNCGASEHVDGVCHGGQD